MSRKLFAIMAITTMFFSCNDDKHDGYKINGTIDSSLNGKKVSLIKSDGSSRTVVDSTVVQNGKMSLIGKVESPDFYMIHFEDISMSLPLIVENTEMNIEFYKDSLQKSAITGSRENEMLNVFRKNSEPLREYNSILSAKFKKAQAEGDTQKMEEAKASFDSILKIANDKNLELVKENKDLLTSVAFLGNLLNTKAITEKEAKEIFYGLSEDIQNSRVGKEIGERIEASLVTAEGSVAPEFSAPTPAGDTIALKDVMGKVTIIDFWAAWCGPCRKENPNVVKVYNKYHDQGLEIIGVSLDGTPRQKDAKKEWTDAIAKDSLTWHQVSNLSYFNDPIAKQYNIQAIPATFILDSEGKIVAKNLRGEELDQKIAELLQ